MAAPAPFALGPGRDNTPLDWTDQAVAKIFYKATLPLHHTFDGKPDNILAFLTAIKNRARNFGWESILTVPHGQNTLHIIDDYGTVTMEQVALVAATYTGNPTRQAQNSEMLFHCLMESITPTFLTEVLLYQANFHVNGTPNGPLLLKQIITMTHIDNTGTSAFIQDALMDMPAKLKALGGNISDLNQWVLDQKQRLASLGEVEPNILPYLWRTYQSAPDHKFVNYIEALKDAHDDNRAKKTAETLMRDAENKYKLLVQCAQWGITSNDQADIVAMMAQVTNKLEQQKASAKKKGPRPPTSTAAAATTFKRAAWKTTPPEAGEQHTKEQNGRTYFWCPYHDTNGMWTIHEPASCRNTTHPNHAESKSSKLSRSTCTTLTTTTPSTIPPKVIPAQSPPATAFSALMLAFGDDQSSDDSN